jgi:two-component system alkaline phosphatase synthesis response regulator PhoP
MGSDYPLIVKQHVRPIILVVEDVEETRDVIELLLESDGYRVDPARNEDAAVSCARRERPGLILVSLAGSEATVIATAERIRQRAELGEAIPVIIFCTVSLDEGAEVGIGRNVYVTRPDNFDQLRAFLKRLLALFPVVPPIN